MSTNRQLRLGPLPKTENIKLTFSCPSDLKAELDRYAALHTQTYGEATDVLALIPHMLAAFMARDRGFRKHPVEDRRKTTRSGPSEPTQTAT